MSEEKGTTIVPDKEMLIAQRNSFQKQLIDNFLDYTRHIQIKEVNGDYTRPTQDGKVIGVDTLIENYRIAAASAKAYVDIIDELLEADKKGTLAEAWENVEQIPSPIEPPEGN